MASSMTSGWTEQATLYWSEAISLTLQVFAGSTVFQNLWVCYLAGSTKSLCYIMTQSSLTVRFALLKIHNYKNSQL